VEVFVPEPRIADVQLGAAASVRIDGLASALQGAVEHIARYTEFTPRYLFSERERPNLVVRVRVRVSDPEQRLRAGVPARVELAGLGSELEPNGGARGE
jgi:HlyD family secretion protein